MEFFWLRIRISKSGYLPSELYVDIKDRYDTGNEGNDNLHSIEEKKNVKKWCIRLANEKNKFSDQASNATTIFFWNKGEESHLKKQSDH